MKKMNVLSGRSNVVRVSQGNTPVRLQDSTQRVAGMMNANRPPAVTRRKSGCKSCGG